MATYTPPPYFPQGSLAPADRNRYRKFKLIIAFVAVVLLLLAAGIAYGVWYLVSGLF